MQIGSGQRNLWPAPRFTVYFFGIDTQHAQDEAHGQGEKLVYRK